MKELSNLIELLGEESTLKLVQEHAGTRVGLPKKMPEDHPLRALLGDAGFALLCQYFGGYEISVPVARAWRFEMYTAQGLTPKRIARLCGCSEDAFYKYRARKGSDRQLEMDFTARR